MKRLILFIAMLALTPVLAHAAKAKKAAKAPAKPAATVVAVVGKPELSLDGGKSFKALKIGQSVPVGGLIRTGSNGKLSLLLSEGSTMQLNSNSEITLKAHNPDEAKGGTIFSMASGFARFVVNKLKPGNHFEVNSPNAVAAVKGTDFNMELHQGGETIVRVFKTDTLSAVELSGLDREKKILLKENTQGGFDGKSFKQDKFEEKDQNEFKNKFEGLPVVEHQGENQTQGDGSGDGSGNQDQAKDENSQNSENGENNVEDVVDDVLDDLYDEVAQDARDEAQDRQNDIAMGRVVYDRQGYLTQVFHRISRPDPYTIQNEAMSRREFGPNQGDTVAIEWTGWNLPMPEDWTTVAGMALNDPANLDGSNYPIYYRKWADFWASNPVGDTFEAYTMFYEPNFHCSACNTPSLLQQGWFQQYYLNGYNGPNGDWYVDYSILEAPGTINSIGGLQLYASSASNIQMAAQADPDNGGWQFDYTRTWSGTTTFLTQHLTLIDDDGNIFDTSGFGGVTSPNDFRGSDLHVEMTLSSNYFSQDIDLIFLQGFFDTFDIIQVPVGYYGCGGC